MEENVDGTFNVSVIIPVYNAEKTIVQTLTSVFEQSFKAFEIILVDDGSKDKSIELVNDTFGKEILNSKMKILAQSNSGPSKARNTGVKIAKGNWIAFLDSDDIWEIDKLNDQIDCIKNNEGLKICATASNISVLGNGEAYTVISYKKLLWKNYFATSSVLIRKSDFMDVGGFNTELSFSEDYNLWLTVLYKNKIGVIVTKKLLKYNVDGDNRLSNKSVQMLKGEYINYKEQLAKKRINFAQLLLLLIFTTLKFFKRVFYKLTIKSIR